MRLQLSLILVMALAAGCSRQSNQGSAAVADLGATVFAQRCAACHREDGTGVQSVYPPLVNSAIVAGDPVELAQWVMNGKRPQGMPAGRTAAQMLQFGFLSDAEIAAVLTYIGSHFGNTAPAVDVRTIARARS